MVDSEGEFSELPDGSIKGPDGVVYRRTPTRLKRRLSSELVLSGSPILTNVYPEGPAWHDGADAKATWQEIEPRLVEGKPPPARDLQWIGHLWESEAGAALLVFEGRH